MNFTICRRRESIRRDERKILKRDLE
jgi:hypothetical protein